MTGCNKVAWGLAAASAACAVTAGYFQAGAVGAFGAAAAQLAGMAAVAGWTGAGKPAATVAATPK